MKINMKKIVFLLLAVLPFALFAQYDRINKNHTDEMNRKQGKWVVFDDMGTKKYEGQFKDNIPFGTFKYFYGDGKQKAVSVFSNNGVTTHTKTFHHDGNLMAEGKYVDQKKDSIWHYYSQYDGILLSEEIYENKIKKGVWRTFYPEQKVAEEMSYFADQKHGPWVQYYTDGSIKMKGQYKNDGKIETKGVYSNSLKEGIWQTFDEEGELLKEETYSKGKIAN